MPSVSLSAAVGSWRTGHFLDSAGLQTYAHLESQPEAEVWLLARSHLRAHASRERFLGQLHTRPWIASSVGWECLVGHGSCLLDGGQGELPREVPRKYQATTPQILPDLPGLVFWDCGRGVHRSRKFRSTLLVDTHLITPQSREHWHQKKPSGILLIFPSHRVSRLFVDVSSYTYHAGQHPPRPRV